MQISKQRLQEQRRVAGKVMLSIGIMLGLLGANEVIAEKIVDPEVHNSSGLMVNIKGIRSNKGTLRLALFKKEKEYPNGLPTGVLTLSAAKIKDGKLHGAFAKLPAGTYALAVYHDENNDNVLDTNMFGIPNEGVGFGNDVKAGMFGPPPFLKASIKIATTGNPTQNVQIRY